MSSLHWRTRQSHFSFSIGSCARGRYTCKLLIFVFNFLFGCLRYRSFLLMLFPLNITLKRVFRPSIFYPTFFQRECTFAWRTAVSMEGSVVSTVDSLRTNPGDYNRKILLNVFVLTFILKNGEKQAFLTAQHENS